MTFKTSSSLRLLVTLAQLAQLDLLLCQDSPVAKAYLLISKCKCSAKTRPPPLQLIRTEVFLLTDKLLGLGSHHTRAKLAQVPPLVVQVFLSSYLMLALRFLEISQVHQKEWLQNTILNSTKKIMGIHLEQVTCLHVTQQLRCRKVEIPSSAAEFRVGTDMWSAMIP